MKTLFEVLGQLCDVFEEHGIPYAIGGSLMLYQKGIHVEVHDIDILLESQSFDVVRKLFQGKDMVEKTIPNHTYPTEHFLEIIINGIEVDLMFAFSIRYLDQVFTFPLDQESLRFQNRTMSFSRIETWYVMYQLMPHRESKVEMIERYFAQHAPNLDVFDDMLKMNYPKKIEDNLRKWCSN